MIYEMRFQTVDPAQRAEYVKIYREAVQGCKSAGSTGGQILCSDDDPSAVIVILLWKAKSIWRAGAGRSLTSHFAPRLRAGKPIRVTADFTSRRPFSRYSPVFSGSAASQVRKVSIDSRFRFQLFSTRSPCSLGHLKGAIHENFKLAKHWRIGYRGR